MHNKSVVPKHSEHPTGGTLRVFKLFE
jgi:hypothetical protein